MQKKILLALFVCTMVTNVNAQIKKGALFLGGSIDFSTQSASDNTSDNSNTRFDISPALGKAVKDNLILGFDLSYGHSKVKSPSYNQKSDSYGAGVFIRKYKVLGKGFYLFVQDHLGADYTAFKNGDNSPQPGIVSRNYSVSLNLYPGISYAVSNKIQLEAGLNNLLSVDYSHQESVGSAKSDSFSLYSSVGTLPYYTLGMRVLLN